MSNAVFGIAIGALVGLALAERSESVFSRIRKGRSRTLPGGVTLLSLTYIIR